MINNNYIFGLSLGCAYKFIEDRNNIISLYKEKFGNKINAIEILLAKEELKTFTFSKENVKWINSLKYKSLHLPNQYNSYFLTLSFLKRNKLNIDSFIAHIDLINNIPKIFQNVDIPILYENVDYKKYSFENIDNICFDVSHAMAQNELFTFYEKNKNYIKQIHLSNTIDNNCHKLFCNTQKNKIDELLYIAYIMKTQKTPIILESICDNIKQLEKEIEYIKGILYE
jgi:hypothetical protein